MPISHLFFGFSGRINRAKAWAGLAVWFAIVLVVSGIFVIFVFDNYYEEILSDPDAFFLTRLAGRLGGFAIIVAVLWVIAFVSQLALAVKRLHDRDKSGWWVLVFVALPWALSLPSADYASNGYRFEYEFSGSGLLGLVALGLYVWAFVELGCLRGTVGPNRFGSDPIPNYWGPGGLAPPAYPGENQGHSRPSSGRSGPPSGPPGPGYPDKTPRRGGPPQAPHPG